MMVFFFIVRLSLGMGNLVAMILFLVVVEVGVFEELVVVGCCDGLLGVDDEGFVALYGGVGDGAGGEHVVAFVVEGEYVGVD